MSFVCRGLRLDWWRVHLADLVHPHVAKLAPHDIDTALSRGSVEVERLAIRREPGLACQLFAEGDVALEHCANEPEPPVTKRADHAFRDRARNGDDLDDRCVVRDPKREVAEIFADRFSTEHRRGQRPGGLLGSCVCVSLDRR